MEKRGGPKFGPTFGSDPEALDIKLVILEDKGSFWW